MRLSTSNEAQIYLLVFFVVLIFELFLSSFWSPLGVSLISGFFGSLALLMPSLRIDLLKRERTYLANLETDGDLDGLKNSIIADLGNNIDRWDPADSVLIFSGAILIACSFLVPIFDHFSGIG